MTCSNSSSFTSSTALSLAADPPNSRKSTIVCKAKCLKDTRLTRQLCSLGGLSITPQRTLILGILENQPQALGSRHLDLRIRLLRLHYPAWLPIHAPRRDAIFTRRVESRKGQINGKMRGGLRTSSLGVAKPLLVGVTGGRDMRFDSRARDIDHGVSDFRDWTGRTLSVG